MHAIRGLLNFFHKPHKCPANCESKPLRSTFRIGVCVRVIFQVGLGLGLLTAYVSLRRRVRRTLYDLYILYFSPEVMVKFMRKTKGHSVTLTQGEMHLITCISGQNWFKGWIVQSSGLFTIHWVTVSTIKSW